MGAPDEGKQSRGGRSKSRDVLVDMNVRLEKVELVVAEGPEKFEETNQCLDELQMGREELQNELQGAVNIVVAIC